MLKTLAQLIIRITLIVVVAYGLYLNLYGAWDSSFQSWLLLFYTTQSNALVMLIFIILYISDSFQLFSSQKTRSVFILKPCCIISLQDLKTAFTWAISITGIVWHLLLVPELAKHPELALTREMLFSVELLHTWSPLLAFADWVLFSPKNQIHRFTPFKWLLIPISYFIFICSWVAFIGPVNIEQGLTYPYPFIDFKANGIAQTWFNISVILLGMLTLGYIYLGLDRLLGALKLRKFKF